MRQLLVLFFVFCITIGYGNAQDTKINYDFSDGQAHFVPINSDNNQPSYQLNVENGVLKMTTKKRLQDWSFLGLFGLNLNLSQMPTLELAVRTNAPGIFNVRIKSEKRSNTAEMEQISVSISMNPSAEFETHFFNLASLIDATPDFDVSKIKEIQIEPTKDWNSTYTAVVELDYFKMGFSEPLPSGGNGFAENFLAGSLPAGAKPSSRFTLSVENNALKVVVNRNSNRWAYFDYELGALYDFSANPFVNLKVKTENDLVMQLFLIDEDGKGYKAELTGSQFKYDELIANQYHFEQARFFKGESFVEATFDFSNALAGKIDLTRIVALRIVTNGTALTYSGTFYIDEIKAGTEALPKAYIGQLPDVTFPQVNLTPKSMVIPEVHNAETIEVSGANNLISNATVSAINYQTANEYYKTTTYGHAFLQFNVNQGASGKEKVTLIAKGKNGFADNTMEFYLTIAGNNPPSIDPINNLEVLTGEPLAVQLSGISDGNPEASQTLTIEASSDNVSVINQIAVVYEQGASKGHLEFTPESKGEANIRVKVTDDGGASVERTFKVGVFELLNGVPSIQPVSKIDLYTTSEPFTVRLSGISDGDNMSQTLSFNIENSNNAVLLQPVVDYHQGENHAQMTLTPTGQQTGTTTITLTITDDGGNANNNGHQSVSIELEVEVTEKPVSGYAIDLAQSNILSIFGPEGNNVNYFLAIVDTLGSKALRIRMKDKWTYGGIFMTLPQELNLAENPIVSYEVFSVQNPSWHWNYFYDAHGRDGSINRNIENSTSHQYQAAVNTWTTLTFDYREPGDLNNSIGEAIDASRINGLLLNMHNAKPAWPFTDASGLLYIRNFKFGDQADFTASETVCTINQPANPVFLENSGTKSMLLTGITNGKNSSENISITASSSNSSVVDQLSPGTIGADGTVALSFKVLNDGTSNITLKIEASGSKSREVMFSVTVLKANAATSTITYSIDDAQQTIRGFGTFQTDARFADLYTLDLGASAVRIGIIGNQWEPVNDNNDPKVINMNGFNFNAFDWDYFRKLKEQGVKTFLLTSWSPPAWMKRNLSLDHREQAIEWEKTDNILETYYYEEFAESMAALAKAFKERCGIDLTAIGLQNEPYFNEPYASAILSGVQFAKLINITGERFKKEGLEQIGFYMPEQVFGLGWGDYSNEGYLNSLKANAEADAFCSYFAVHGYDGSGITSGFPDYSNWNKLWELASTGNHPKEMWMTETHIGYQDWNSAMNTAGALHGSLWAGNISLWTNWSFEDMQLTKNQPNSTFYASKNYLKYIRPGAVRVNTASDNPDLMPTAFINEDGKFVMVIINKGSKAIPVDLKGKKLPSTFELYRTSQFENFINDETFKPNETVLIVPASSIITLVAETMNTLSIDPIDDVKVPKNAAQTINITGISTENGSIDDLSITFINSNEALFNAFTVSEISNNGTALIDFTSQNDQMGEAHIKVIVTDQTGNSVSTVFTITVGNVGIEKYHSLNKDYKLINQSEMGKVMIEVNESSFNTYRLFDVNGKVRSKGSLIQKTTEIDVSDLPAGIYFINLNGKTSSQSAKFWVK
ncbi:MAG: T9SS type A sorting domain-containing protein [Prolixibacteraceae bacterium]|nr:T9SS type A sorting domain-containing protein [Prolixibacteraceae bacterium]